MTQSQNFAKISDLEPQAESLKQIRHHLHANPELSFEEEKTAALVADKLEKWGYEVTRNVGGHGVVGRLRVGDGNRSVAIRADMDALPMLEETGLPYASNVPGKMHACGHDGHTTMLLGAAEYLARTKNFSGTVNLVFQPAEEAGKISGAQAMIADGLFDRFPCDAIFGLHNHPGIPVGHVMTRSGPLMAASDTANIEVVGKGGHASRPHQTVDPIVVASSIVMALQTIVARNIDPTQTAVITVGSIHGGEASNVIPSHVTLGVSIRSFTPEIRDILEQRVRELINAQAASYGATIELEYERGYPVVINSAEENEFATGVVKDLIGEDKVSLCPLIPGSEDFSYFLEHKPGAFLRLGNGENSAILHNTKYDFNDENLVVGAAIWARVAESFLARG